MIMAKFEALERIQSRLAEKAVPGVDEQNSAPNLALDVMTQADQKSSDGCLSDKQLLEVFKQVGGGRHWGVDRVLNTGL